MAMCMNSRGLLETLIATDAKTGGGAVRENGICMKKIAKE